MGLDATVMCNCFREGKTTPPPFPREWLVVDEEGYLSPTKEYDADEIWIQQIQWKRSCCEHPDMDFACERISNWAGYRQFQEALAEVGWQHFPVLKEQLPNVNGGLTPSTESAKALKELKLFVAAGEIGSKTVLVDTASGEGLYEHIPTYDGIFIYSGGVNVGLSEFDFFAVDRMSGVDRFRAARFRQFRTSGEKITDCCDDLVWENLDTGEIFESGIAIKGKPIPEEDGSRRSPDGKCRYEIPSELHVERRVRYVADFDDIIKALQTVFEASVQTGNPVRWC